MDSPPFFVAQLCMDPGTDADTFCRTQAPAMLNATYDFATGRSGLGHSCAAFLDCEAVEAGVFNETCPHPEAVGSPAVVCAPTDCTAGSCRVVDGVGICECNVLEDCGGTSVTLNCTPEVGSGDPPVIHTGPPTHALAATSRIQVDTTASSLTMSSCFEFGGIEYCASDEAAIRGEVSLYGRPSADGSGDFQIDFGLFIEDVRLDFGFIPILGNVVVNATDVYALGGGGPTPLHVDASGRGAVPRGAMNLSVHAVQDGTEIQALGAPVSRDVPFVVDFAAGSFRIPRLGFALDGVTGEITLEGTFVNQPPVAVAAAPATVECTSVDGAEVLLDGTGSSDPDDDVRHSTWFLGPAFDPASTAVGFDTSVSVLQPIGEAQYDLLIGDVAGQLAVDTVGVAVVDTTPPSIAAEASPGCLFPPNHDWVVYEIGDGLEIDIEDACDADPTVRIVDVASSQPALGGGSGNTSPDVAFSETALCVRRERAGTTREDREYSVRLQTTDGAGNVAEQAVVIRVPHDRRGGDVEGCRAVGPSRLVAPGDPRCEG